MDDGNGDNAADKKMEDVAKQVETLNLAAGEKKKPGTNVKTLLERDDLVNFVQFSSVSNTQQASVDVYDEIVRVLLHDDSIYLVKQT
ncbi:hypothetical protein V2J09_023931 [Rumex salicifolius]